MPATSSSSAYDVAAALIEAHPGLDQMQLHKLLYLVQAASLVWFDEPAFNDQRIEAWLYGPMVRGVAGHYMDYGKQPIERPSSGDPRRLSPRLSRIVSEVADEFAEFDGPTLARFVKGAGSPWKTVRGDLPDDSRSDAEIPHRLIGEFHRRHGLGPYELTEGEKRSAQAFLDGDDDSLADLFELATGVRPSIS